MLVGRQTEQQAIDRLMAEARLGTSGVLVLVGEAGVGKTALLEAAVESLEDMRVLRATGLESEREIPFAAMLQLIRPALGLLESIPPSQGAALATALALPSHRAATMPDARDRFAIGAALLSLLCRYAEDGPVVVVVDDVHLVDTPTANALMFSARRLAADPVAVLMSARSPDGDSVVAGLPVVRVHGLDLEASRALIVRARDQGVPAQHVRRLHRATAGNPLALLELSDADDDVRESLETGLPLRVPRAIVAAFGRRLAQIDDECRTVLLTAAVCGGDLRVITGACDALGVDVTRLADAEDQGLITVRGEAVEFRHPLLRAAAYSAASAQQRQAAHRAAAGALPLRDVDRRAWHLAEATWHPDAIVSDLLAEAGELSISRAAYSVAARAFERAAHLSPDDEERGARLLRAAEAAWTAGMSDRALSLLDEHDRAFARGEPGGVGTAGVPALELRAAIAARSGSLREALESLLTAADGTTDADDATLLLADAVHATYYLGDARTASVLADRLALLEGSITTPRARALSLMATGMAKVLAGRGGADDIRAAVPLLETDPTLLHDPRRLSWLMLAPLYLRDATGGARLRALVEEVRGAAGVGALPAVLFHVARDQAAASSWARAEANYVEAIRLAIETGQTTELAMSLAGLCAMESRAGKADTCRLHAAQAREICAARAIHMGEVWVGYALGDLELSLGDAARSVEHLSALVRLLEELGLDDADLAPAPELTDGLLRLGRRDEARSVAAAFRERAVDKGQPWARARSDRACGQAAADEDVDTWFSSALGWHAETLDAFESARTRLAYGERLRRIGRRVDARVQLRAALTGFSALGAGIWTERAAAELTATGEHVRAAVAGGLSDLTPQELQVSVVLSEGRTTREAAAALFLSPKTVEYHLRKVYTKLGISSRSELAALLAETGDSG